MSAQNIKKVLVTGANGFFGRHLVEKLLNDKLSVVAVDKSNSDALAGMGGDLEIVKLDITKAFDIKDVGSDIDAVVHLAGIVGEGACSKDIQNTYNLNITGVVNLINCFHDSGLGKFVYISSISVYDKTDVLPITIDHKTSISGIYNSTKLAAEMLLSSYCSKYDISWSIARTSNTYGPYQLDYSIVSYIIMGLFKHDELTLFSPGDVKDFVFITDVAEAIATLINTDESGIYNISSGKGTSLSEMAETIGDIFGKEITVKAEDEEKARKNCTKLIIDNTGLTKLGWSPKVSLHEGMQKTINYFNQRMVNGDKK